MGGRGRAGELIYVSMAAGPAPRAAVGPGASRSRTADELVDLLKGSERCPSTSRPWSSSNSIATWRLYADALADLGRAHRLESQAPGLARREEGGGPRRPPIPSVPRRLAARPTTKSSRRTFAVKRRMCTVPTAADLALEAAAVAVSRSAPWRRRVRRPKRPKPAALVAFNP